MKFLSEKSRKERKFYLICTVLFATMLLLGSCSDDDDPDNVNEEEEITTVTLSFIPEAGSSATMVEATWRDLDGGGGDDPEIEVVRLQANVNYRLNLSLLNEEEDEDVNEEIERELEEHQFFFEVSNGLNMTIDYSDNDADKDANDQPVGLEGNIVNTTNASTGTLVVTLRHELDKDGAGVVDGQIANAGGETDIMTTFNVEIEE